MHPAFFLVYGAAVFVFFLLGFLRVRALWRLEQRLLVPAKASHPCAERPASPVLPRPGACRDGQLFRAEAQERAARAALRSAGRVDVAPARCPLDRDEVGTP